MTQRDTQARGKPPEPTMKGEEAFFREERPRGHVWRGRRDSVVPAEAREPALGAERGARVSAVGAPGAPGRNEGPERGQGPEGEGVGATLRSGGWPASGGSCGQRRTLTRKEVGPVWGRRKLARGSSEAAESAEGRGGRGRGGQCGERGRRGPRCLPPARRQDLAPRPPPLWGRHCTGGRAVRPSATCSPAWLCMQPTRNLKFT